MRVHLREKDLKTTALMKLKKILVIGVGQYVQYNLKDYLFTGGLHKV